MPASSAKTQSFPRPTRGTQRLLRYPIFIIVILIVLIELLAYFILRLGVIIYEAIQILFQCRSNSILWKALKNCKSYDEYVELAKDLDLNNGRNEWKFDPNAYSYDTQIVSQNLAEMKLNQQNKDFVKLSENLIEIFNHILKWFEDESLYTQCNYGTKYIVEEFIDNVENSIKRIRNCTRFSVDDKLKIFCRLQQEFGRTCLCLSGGATMTYHQFGVIKTLLQYGLLPKIISGTSGGALVGCCAAVRTDEELKSFLDPKVYKLFTPASEPLVIRLERLLRTGYMFDWEDWRQKLRKLTKGDMTFYEAYKLTGRIFNVSAISTNHTPVLCNYKTTPNVVIWSAVIASAALPLCMKPSPLMAKKYLVTSTHNHHQHQHQNGRSRRTSRREGEQKYELVQHAAYGKLWFDGSIKYDIPKHRLLEDFNVKYTICVQCNLHVFVFYYNERGTANTPVSHWGRSGMRGGFLSSFLEKILKLELRKWMQVLSDFDLLPQIFSIDLRHIALQENRGTITMNPRPTLCDMLYLTVDPDYQRMKHYFRRGAQVCYPFVYMIQNRIRLQNAIRDAIKYLDKQLDDDDDKHDTLQTMLNEGYSINCGLPQVLRKKENVNSFNLTVGRRSSF
eukprot:CAMPEP_0202685990 /NCGR_PEP_ID=MMETSP1385-20130828/1774_1 /ASSEMBLY_ACC=CAM_ASM_000861 /TAXON_ID=933848 /ORGANISM="Elphidium margaritaceum" /LENGTH=618 /DNA_ID=CAMNT_0049340469 /DNA_START=24 /DNA_END=1880 /DNA_ORIENTATION=-